VGAAVVPLLPFIAHEFNLSATQTGFIITAFSVTSGLSQLPGGFLADKLGPRKMITLSICGIGASGLFIGLSNNLEIMLIFLIFLGVFGGGYHPSVPPLLSASVPPEIRGKAFGFHIIGGNTAYFLAPLIGAGIAAIWGWRAAFFSLSIPALIFGIIFYILIGKIIIKITQSQTHLDNASLPKHPESKPGQMILFILLTAVTSSLSASAASFLPFFSQDRFALSASAAAVYVAVMNSSGLWASPLGGHLSDRIGTIPAVLISCLVAGPIIYLVTISPYGVLYVLSIFMWGALFSIRMPATESYIMSTANPKRVSTIFGISYAASQHGTGILAPLLGYLIDHSGYVQAFQIVALLSLVVALILGIPLWQSTRTKRMI
jgi:MFS transporter, FSR family, fosmidomycin resistance protein